MLLKTDANIEPIRHISDERSDGQCRRDSQRSDGDLPRRTGSSYRGRDVYLRTLSRSLRETTAISNFRRALGASELVQRQVLTGCSQDRSVFTERANGLDLDVNRTIVNQLGHLERTSRNTDDSASAGRSGTRSEMPCVAQHSSIASTVRTFSTMRWSLSAA